MVGEALGEHVDQVIEQVRLRARSRFGSPEDLVFASERGTPLIERNLTRRYLKPVGEKLGLPWLSWHVFRHSHSTFAEQIGMALSDRQAQMGHADITMTLHYTHSDLERRRAAVY
jgi:integrase